MRNNNQQFNKLKISSTEKRKFEEGLENNKKSQSKEKTKTVVSVKNVSKVFGIPHKKVDSLRSVFVNMGRGLSTYEEFNALKDVSFEVKKGEFFGIIGRNGSGKSTLLKILAGVYAQDKGEVEINGLVSPFLELGIGFNPELSGRDNIYLNATVLGLTEKEIDEKFDDIVRFAELEKFIDQQLKNYSSGMSVRLAFSVSIHANRDILLMDEVLAVGDANFQKKCIKIFEGYSDTNRTVILVTHDIGAVRKYCDRAMLLHNGEMIKVGDVNEVCDEYVMKNMTEESFAELEEKDKENKLKNKTQDKVKKNKVAEIVKIEFLDKNSNKKDIFKTGDDLLIRVYFKYNQEKILLNFGLAIFGEKEEYILGINTFLDDDVNIKKYIENGFFQVLYTDIPLRTGRYHIKAGIWLDNIGENIDFLEKSSHCFNVFISDENDGFVQMKYEWL